VGRKLLRLLLEAFVAQDATVVMGADETLERRRGAKIAGIGCFRDAARSTSKQKVKSMGLRWVSMMLLVKVPWSKRVWGLPFLTILAPNQKTNTQMGKRHKTSIQWIQQMLSQVRRWLPGRRVVLVVDGGLAALKLGLSCQHYQEPVTYITRLQLNARLFDRPAERVPGTRGRPRIVGERQDIAQACLNAPDTDWQTTEVAWYDGHTHTVRFQSASALWYTCGKPPLLGRWVLLHDPTNPHLNTCLLFATDPNLSPHDIIAWFIQRWSMEVTFEEVRAHLGFETQRQWNPLAVARSSPALLGLFSFVTLLAHTLSHPQPLPVRSTAWYAKPEATFSDCLAFVRSYLWSHTHFPTAHASPPSVNIPLALLDDWLDLLCYAA
jgi:hypothetical protein